MRALRTTCLRLFCLVALAGGHAHGVDLAGLKQQTLVVASLADTNKIAEQLSVLARQDIKHLSTRDFILIADSYGNLVSRTRDLGGGMADFNSLIERADDLFKRCRDKVRDLESETNEDEARLETLYRSDIWHDINYSLSALRYWQAWALLGIAHSKEGERDEASWLDKADKGFQASSVRILYPGIVYGSWLGMGYVAQARGDQALAEKRFRRLTQALVSDPENPVRKIAEGELTVIAIRRGEILPVGKVGEETLSPSQANLRLEEAFMLLKKHRETGTGAIEAAARLKRLIAEGYLSNSLVSRIMSYRDEIVGQDLGVFSVYVDMEFAYINEQYDTAVLKYRAFEKQGGLNMLINLRTMQYHYAVALLKIHQYHDALAVAENLRQQSDLPQPVIAALPKLSFLIAQALYDQKESNRNRVRLLNAAEYFLTKSADDSDTSRAHLVLGQLSFNPERAKAHLKIARQDRKLRGSITLAQLKRSITAFNQASLARGNTERMRQAEQVLVSLKELPRHISNQPWVRAVKLQMRTVLEQDLEGVLSSIEQIYASAIDSNKVTLDSNVKQILLWSQLRALDKVDQAKLLSLIDSAKAPDSEAGVKKEIYRFLIEQEQLGQFATLSRYTEAFYPALDGQTQDQRQLRLLQIRTATALGDNQKAFIMARTMTQEFSNSGDAWTAYAETAEAVNDNFTAERAWAKITGAQPDGAPRWREAMARRIELLSRLGDRREELCAAIKSAQRYRHLASKNERLDYSQRSERNGCS